MATTEKRRRRPAWTSLAVGGVVANRTRRDLSVIPRYNFDRKDLHRVDVRFSRRFSLNGRFSIDPQRVYLAGMSGGVRVAMAIALAGNNIAGVIASSAVRSVAFSRTAGIAAQKDESFVFEGFEDYVAPYAPRDMALHTHDYTTAEDLLCQRFYMSKDGPVNIDLYNFRIWPLLAHLQLMQGNTARADQVLQSVIAWIDAEDKYGPVFNLRTRAQALMMLGRREEALRDLAASFAVDHDIVQWWYAIERDPLWNDVRETAEFRALAAGARRVVDRERAAVEELRRQGRIPRRPSVSAPAR